MNDRGFETVLSHHLPNCVHYHPTLPIKPPSKSTSLGAVEEEMAQSISTTDQVLAFAGHVLNVVLNTGKESQRLEYMNNLKSHIKIDKSSATVRYFGDAESDFPCKIINPAGKYIILDESTFAGHWEL